MILKNTSIIIKTFNRYNALRRLLLSIESNFSYAEVVIVDDGIFRNWNKKRILNEFINLDLKYVITKFDIGLSKGKNELMKYASNEYVVLCDDDFILSNKIPFDYAINAINDKKFDFISGPVYDYFKINTLYSLFALVKKVNRRSMIHKSPVHYEESALNKLSIDGQKIMTTSYINNFFITRKEYLEKINGWQPEDLKLFEHSLFNKRLGEHKFKLGYLESFSVDSIRYLPLIYWPFRFRNKKKYNSIVKKYLENRNV